MAVNLIGPEFQVNTYTSSYQFSNSLAMDSDGDFVVSWESNGQSFSDNEVYAQRYNAAGVAQGEEFRVNTTTANRQKYSSVAMDTDGDFVVTWISRYQDGSGYGVYAQRYNTAGIAQGEEFRVNTTTANSQSISKVAIDADGDFVVAWTSFSQDFSDFEVYAQQYNAAGVAQGEEFRVNTTTSNRQLSSTVAMDADGDYVVTWTSYGQDGSGSGVYAQRYEVYPSIDAVGGQKQFTVSQGDGTVALTNFGGVGKGTNPSTAVIAEADILKLEGPDLTARNLLLTQTGGNLEISFEGVADTKVIVRNVALENLDNLLKPRRASVDLGNILFNGQMKTQDSYDVLDADSTQISLFNRNSVTFLNDLDNTLVGFDNSNDVINAQGGNDYIDGGSGNDLLRGGIGIDILVGGSGNDSFAGDGGNDYLQGGVGTDRFFYSTDHDFVSADVGVDIFPDFVRGTDKIGLDKTTFTTLNDGFSFQRVFSDAAAGGSSADIVYSSASGSMSGKLFYNTNSTKEGFGTGAQFATLTNLTSPLAASDFLVLT